MIKTKAELEAVIVRLQRTAARMPPGSLYCDECEHVYTAEEQRTRSPHRLVCYCGREWDD